jgi:hypothetical protein
VPVVGSLHRIPVKVVLMRRVDSKRAYDWALVTTDTAATGEAVIVGYGARWSIEQAMRDGKEVLGAGQTQSRLKRAVERSVPFVMACLGSYRRVTAKLQSPCSPTPRSAKPSSTSSPPRRRPGGPPPSPPTATTPSPPSSAWSLAPRWRPTHRHVRICGSPGLRCPGLPDHGPWRGLCPVYGTIGCCDQRGRHPPKAVGERR